MKVNHSPDIGRCDDCGSEYGQRHRITRTIAIAGTPELTDVWLCSSCQPPTTLTDQADT